MVHLSLPTEENNILQSIIYCNKIFYRNRKEDKAIFSFTTMHFIDLHLIYIFSDFHKLNFLLIKLRSQNSAYLTFQKVLKLSHVRSLTNEWTTRTLNSQNMVILHQNFNRRVSIKITITVRKEAEMSSFVGNKFNIATHTYPDTVTII